VPELPPDPAAAYAQGYALAIIDAWWFHHNRKHGPLLDNDEGRRAVKEDLERHLRNQGFTEVETRLVNGRVHVKARLQQDTHFPIDTHMEV